MALAAGGTGGHLFPAQALAAELIGRGIEPLLITDARGARFAADSPDLPYVILPAATLAGGPIAKARAAAVIASSAGRAAALLRRRRAQLMVGFGGYPSFAPALGARLLRLPLLLQEQATKFSLANRKLLPFADRVALSFPIDDPAAQGPRARLTGPPLREPIRRAAGAAYPSLEGAIELLVVGGSQGARVFGEAVPAALLALPEALRRRLRVALQYRGDDAPEIAARLEAAGIATEIAPFFHDMADRLVRAHLVVSRAGASTIADLTAIGRPAIFVPIPVGGSTDEQRRNALSFVAAGAGWHLPQDQLETGALTPLLVDLIEQDRLPAAAAASAKLGRADGAARLADLVEEMIAARP